MGRVGRTKDELFVTNKLEETKDKNDKMRERYERICIENFPKLNEKERDMIGSFLSSIKSPDPDSFHRILYSRISTGDYSVDDWMPIYEKIQSLNLSQRIAIVESL